MRASIGAIESCGPRYTGARTHYPTHVDLTDILPRSVPASLVQDLSHLSRWFSMVSSVEEISSAMGLLEELTTSKSNQSAKVSNPRLECGWVRNKY